MEIFHESSSNVNEIRAIDGEIHIQADNFMLISDDTSGRAIYLNNSGGHLELGFDGNHDARFTGSGVSFLTGIDVTGNITVSGTVDGVDIAALNTTVSNITTDLVTDTTPQLGGNLDTNSFEISLDDGHAVKFGDGSDMTVYHTGSAGYIANSTGNMIIQTDAFRVYNGNGSHDMIQANNGGAVNLYYNNSKKFETNNEGVRVSGILEMLDNKRIQLGDGDDFQIYHDGSNNYLKGTQNQLIYIGTNNVDRWYFANDGHFRPEANNSYDIGSSSQRVRNIYTNDLHLSNEGSSNDVDGSWGDWTIQEGESDLFLKNNRSGKKYKFNLTEVS